MPSSIISVGYLKKAAERINSETNGKVDLKIFPDSQLGSDADMLSQLRSGALTMLSGTTGSLGTLVPAASLSTVGFAFDTYDQVWKAMDGELGAHIRSELDKVGIVYLNVFDAGFRQITTSSVQVKSVDQMSGLKIRVPTSPIYASMFRAMGASPTTINFGEVYSALQTKLVDGQENPLSLIQSAKLYEVPKRLRPVQPCLGWPPDVYQQGGLEQDAEGRSGHHHARIQGDGDRATCRNGRAG